MEKIKYECEVVTPMFSGGENSNFAEIRGQSIKGLLRFWWRAFNICKLDNDLKALKEEEGKIFGSSLSGQERKSSFKIKIIENKIIKNKSKLPQYSESVSSKGKNFNINLLEYLCFGIYDPQSRAIKREYIDVNSKFDIEFLIEKPEFKQDILDSFYLLVYFGGIGSKNRNGFGKIKISEDKFDYILEKIKKSKQDKNSDVHFLSFNKNIRIYQITDSYNNWSDCLGNLGKIYRDARLKLEEKHNYEKRQYIGAPIIINPGGQQSVLARKGKPVFLNVLKNGQVYKGYILYLHSDTYYPNPENNKISNITYQAVCKKFLDFLDADKRLTSIL